MPPLVLALWEQARCIEDLSCKDQSVEDQGAHSIFWDGEESPFLFRTFKVGWRHFVFARPVESGDEGNWLVCEDPARRQHKFPLTPPEHRADIARSLCQNDGQFFLARFCVVDERLSTPYVILFEDGQGVWLGEDLNDLSPFRFEMESATFRGDGRGVANRVLEWVCDPEHDISFARRWTTLEGWEKVNLVLRGLASKQRIETVMCWALVCEPFLWTQGDEWMWTLINSFDPHYGGVLSPDRRIGFPPKAFEEKLPLLFRVQRFLLDSYIPFLAEPLRQRHPCVRDYPRPYGESGEYYLSVSVRGEPSAHERMEAYLQLREWLERNALPDELEALGLL